MSNSGHLTDDQRNHQDALSGACSEMAKLATHVAAFARLLAHHRNTGNETAGLDAWITAVTTDDLPALRSFANGLEKDRAAVQSSGNPAGNDNRQHRRDAGEVMR